VDGLRGVGVALETVATLALMCDPRDLGTTLGDAGSGPSAHPDLETDLEREEHTDVTIPIPRRVSGGPSAGYNPTLFLFEHTPGGIGLAERVFERRDVLLARAHALVTSCRCASGCPACVGPSDLSRKVVALELMRRALGNLRAL
jgi:DEAD/DEAH box helicase domain-containing protein